MPKKHYHHKNKEKLKNVIFVGKWFVIGRAFQFVIFEVQTEAQPQADGHGGIVVGAADVAASCECTGQFSAIAAGTCGLCDAP